MINLLLEERLDLTLLLTGAFGPIREWFAGLPESKARGYKVGRYSFNVKGGRCETCEGDGVITYEMHFYLMYLFLVIHVKEQDITGKH